MVGDTVTKPAVPPLIEATRKARCRTSTGGGVYDAVGDLMVEFLTTDGRLDHR